MRGRSYSPSSPPRGYGRRGRSPSPRGRYGGGGGGGGGSRSRGDAPTSLLVRNLRRDCRPDDLRRPFGHFGPVKDIYLPRDYYSGEPRGFGFIQFVEPADAGEAKYQMDGSVFQGRQLTVVFAEENRKKPQDMRVRERGSRGRTHDRRRSPARYSRSPQYSQTPPPRRARSRSHEYDSPPPKRKQELRSVSPQEKRHSRERSYSRSPPRGGHSPPFEGSRSRSRSLDRKRPSSPPPPYNGGGGGGSRSRSRSPVMRSPSPSRGRSRKAERVYSPPPPPPPRGELERGGGSHKD